MFAIASEASRPRSLARRSLNLTVVAYLCASCLGCGLLGSDPEIAGEYRFSNAFGYTETLVVAPDRSEEIRFEVSGVLTLSERDGAITGAGSCLRTTIRVAQPAGTETRTELATDASITGKRSGSTVREFRIEDCAFPRRMFGTVSGGRIVLNTDLDFPVSRGTTVISERFGDPTRLVLTGSDG